MVAPVIYIRRFVNGTVNYVYRVRNFDNFSVRFRSPISPMPLPEENDDQNILVKVEGNTTTITLNWVINETTVNTGSNHNGASAPGSTKTIFEQLLFWQDFLIGNSITSGFDIVLGDENTTDLDALTPNGINYQKRGFSTDFNATTQGAEPNSFRGMFTMIVGNVVTGYNTNSPSEPLNYDVVSGSLSGEIDVSWDDPADAGSSAISGHIVKFKTGTGQWDTATASAAANALTISGLVAGNNYQLKMYAQNDGGGADGRVTPIREAIATV